MASGGFEDTMLNRKMAAAEEQHTAETVLAGLRCTMMEPDPSAGNLKQSAENINTLCRCYASHPVKPTKKICFKGPFTDWHSKELLTDSAPAPSSSTCTQQSRLSVRVTSVSFTAKLSFHMFCTA